MKKVVSRKYKIIISVLGIIIMLVLFTSKQSYKPIEELDIANSLGWDIEKDVNGDVLYSIPINVFVYKDYKQSGTVVHSGTGRNISETRTDRQRKSNKTFLLGSEIVNIISEDMAKHGLEFMTNILFSNPTINDNSISVVCQGKAQDIMKFQSKEYSSAGEYLEGLIVNMQNYSFFSDNYNAIDIYTRQKAEGRNICLPYVVINNCSLQIDGMAIFKGEKMIGKLNMKDTVLLNILKENDVKGALSLTESSNNSISFEGISKRKVKCSKNEETGQYEFSININISGTVTANTLYKDIATDPKVQKQFTEDLEKDIESRCYCFIDRMQNEYKTDLLELGRNAAAKYGRNKGENWNEIVSNSNIKVNVEVKINLLNRGQY